MATLYASSRDFGSRSLTFEDNVLSARASMNDLTATTHCALKAVPDMRASLTVECPEPVSLAPHRLVVFVWTVASDTARFDQRCHTWSSTVPLGQTKYRESQLPTPRGSGSQVRPGRTSVGLVSPRPSIRYSYRRW